MYVPRGGATSVFSAAGHDRSIRATASRRQVSPVEEWFDVALNGSLLLGIKGPPVNYKTPGRLCVRVDANWNCLSWLGVWYGRITSEYHVAYSPLGDELILTVSRDSSDYWVGTQWSACGGGDRCVDHGLLQETLGSELIFISVPRQAVARRMGAPSARRGFPRGRRRYRAAPIASAPGAASDRDNWRSPRTARNGYDSRAPAHAASRAGVGPSQLARVANHCGPIPLSWALAFWTLRLRILRGARVAR
ncbi:hypothetical protein BH23GEM3_BH23GEM3_10520 [soil metagenome]